MKKIIFPAILALQFTFLSADCEDFFEEIPESETFLFCAKEARLSGSSQDVSYLAREAVHTAYSAFKPSFDQKVAQERQKLIALGAQRSSAYNNIPTMLALPLADRIINQIDVLAKKLTPQQRQQFWGIAEKEIKSCVTDFCRGHGASISNNVLQHISSQIKLKKLFG